MNQTIKTVTLLIILCVTIIGFGIFSQLTLQTHSLALEKHLQSIEDAVNRRNWSNAINEYAKMKDEWTAMEKTWTLLIDHFEIDAIDISLARLEQFLSSQNIALSLSETASLLQNTKHIPEKEKFNLENIL